MLISNIYRVDSVNITNLS